MKKLLTLSISLFFCLLVQAQVKTDCSRVIVGAVTTISPELSTGLKRARYEVGNYQIALISARPFTACYYAIYNAAGHIVASGPYRTRRIGEVRVINVYALASDCRVVLSEKPLITSK
jgi:hypothetical protein